MLLQIPVVPLLAGSVAALWLVDFILIVRLFV